MKHMTPSLKTLALTSLAILGLASASLVSANTTGQTTTTHQSSHNRAAQPFGQAYPTYEQQKAAIEASGLSQAQKQEALKALEANKGDLDKLASLQQKEADLYQKAFGQLHTNYQTLMTKNQALWTKLLTSRRQADLEDSLDDWSQRDVAEIRAQLAASNLTAAEKATLGKDLDGLEKLVSQYDKAYQTYATEAIQLDASMDQLEAKLASSQAASGAYFGDWDDRYDWDDQFDRWDDAFDWDDDRDDWDDREDWD